jgi:exodeoxyribonuclease V alpha subunit
MQTELKPEPPKTSASLIGVVDAISYFSEDTGYSILRVRVDRTEPCTVIGTTPAVNLGEWVSARGKWVVDPEFGRQFRAEILYTTPPQTENGLLRYLSSGCVPGIDAEIAHNLIRAFGTSVLDVIRKDPARLVQIKGIDKDRCAYIRNALNQELAMKSIVLFLQEHGVHPSRTIRALKNLGKNPIGQIQANPYCILRAGRSIDFALADLIAQSLNHPKDSALRIEAGLEYTLMSAGKDGHCALPRTTLLEEAEKLLVLPRQIVAATFDQLTKSDRLTVETIDGMHLVFHPGAKRAEENIVATLVRLAGERTRYPRFNVDKTIDWCEAEIDKKLELSQREALHLAFKKRVVIITGGPGSGKTTLVNSILKILARQSVRILMCAPTGRAAKRLTETTGWEASTIHRLLEIDPATGEFTRNEEFPLPCDLLVVDETSMVDVFMMESVVRALPKNAALILIGDVDQIPSVGPGCVLRDLIDSGVVPVVCLKGNHRQGAGSSIISVAQSILAGQMPEFRNKPDSDCFFFERNSPDESLATIIALVKERIPKSRGYDATQDVQVLAPMHLGQVGVKSLNTSLQKALNPIRTGRPRIDQNGNVYQAGDKVIQTENDYELNVFNGDIGFIGHIDKKKRRVNVNLDERMIQYTYSDLEALGLAYAITIHKSQGSEFPVVIIPLSMQQKRMLQRNLIFTGATRAQKMLVFVGEKRALEVAIANDKAQMRYTGLKDRLRAIAA